MMQHFSHCVFFFWACSGPTPISKSPDYWWMQEVYDKMSKVPQYNKSNHRHKKPLVLAQPITIKSQLIYIWLNIYCHCLIGHWNWHEQRATPPTFYGIRGVIPRCGVRWIRTMQFKTLKCLEMSLFNVFYDFGVSTPFICSTSSRFLFSSIWNPL